VAATPPTFLSMGASPFDAGIDQKTGHVFLSMGASPFDAGIDEKPEAAGFPLKTGLYR